MKLNLTDDQVKMIIAALMYYATMEAGQTQEPDLCEPSDYDEHALAISIDRRLTASTHLRRLWMLNPRTGEKELQQ